MIKIVDITDISRNEKQPRKNFDEKKLEELAASIKEQGILQPLLVEEIESNKYRIIAGERRYRAATIAGIDKLPVIVRKFNNVQKMQVAIIENVQREDLNPIEEAYAYMYLMREGGMTQEEVANKVGKSRSAISNTIRLVSLQQKYVNSLIKGEISQGHARAILSLQNPPDREFLYKKIISENLNVRDSENLASFLNNGGLVNQNFNIKKLRDSVLLNENTNLNAQNETDIEIFNDEEEKKEPDKANYIKKRNKKSVDEMSIMKEMENKFSRILNMKVKLKGSAKCGKMQLSYISYDDLNNLYKKITGSSEDLIQEED